MVRNSSSSVSPVRGRHRSRPALDTAEKGIPETLAAIKKAAEG